MSQSVKILDSAYKHDLSDDDIMYVYENRYATLRLRDDPLKYLVFGFDLKARALEIGVVEGHTGGECIIHAMKLRKQYERLL
jgi:hypothetical protein